MTETSAIAQRNLMRAGIQTVADGLADESLSSIEAADQLRQICSDDIIDLDQDDIDIDFDAGPPLAAMASAKPAPPDDGSHGNPVEIALSRAVKLRDRVNGLTIVGDIPGPQDRKDYLAALSELKAALDNFSEI